MIGLIICWFFCKMMEEANREDVGFWFFWKCMEGIIVIVLIIRVFNSLIQ